MVGLLNDVFGTGAAITGFGLGAAAGTPTRGGGGRVCAGGLLEPQPILKWQRV